MAVAPASGVFIGVTWLWMLGSGFVLPLGLPPGPEDPAVANVAPQECLFYMGWASMAKPDPKAPPARATLRRARGPAACRHGRTLSPQWAPRVDGRRRRRAQSDGR